MTTALVVGGGIAGLTCALRLAESGFDVGLVARDFFPATTSAVAAAVWYPYRAYPRDRVLGWAASSLRRFQELTNDPRSGVSLVELREYFTAPAADPWWKPALPEFRRLERSDIAPGYVDGCSFRVPLMETERYLPFLTGLLEQRGVRIEQRVIKTLDACDCDMVVNCSGLGARDLCHDKDLFPIRGQVVRTEKPIVSNASVVHGTGPRGVTYVIPRSVDCVLGTTAEDHNWDPSVNESETRQILARCTSLEPALQGTRILDARAGLRPGRNSVRLEREGRVIHNYGHGGSGFTLSWGCADEVLELARSV